MGIEIERKFLLQSDAWRREISLSHTLRQGYLVSDATRSVRVRVGDNGAQLNIKSATLGMERREYEYEIPRNEGEELLGLCQQPLLEKVRHFVHRDGHCWEIDEFGGCNAGLIVAEIELTHRHQAITLPPWIGQEVTMDKRYYNAYLVQYPYRRWSEEESRRDE
ncbi:MAG: CYTH domain-containing protein [Candidatus Competibacterales bacterium]